MYPRLKDTAIIKRRAYGCWAIDTLDSFNQGISPAAATMLAICDGSMTKDEIVSMCAPQFEISEKDCVELFDGVAPLLAWTDEAVDLPRRYDPLDFFFYPKIMKPERRGRMDRPVDLLFSLTNRCNFRCVYCFNASGTPQKAEEQRNSELSTDEWLRLIEQAVALDVAQITITGGEPLLHPGIEQILTAIAERSIVPHLCTNGSLLTPKLAALLKSLGVPCVQISMDSADDSICDGLTQCRGSLKSITNAITILRDAGVTVTVKAVLTTGNLSTVMGLLEHLNSIGVSRVMLERFDISSCGRGSESMLIADEDIEAVNDIVKDFRAAHPDAKLHVRVTGNHLHWKDNNDVISCGALKSNMIILPSGNVTICEKLVDVPEATVGNVRKQTIAEVWDSPRVNEVLAPLIDRYDPVCRQCEMFDSCRAGCYSLKLTLGKDMYGIDPRCFHAEQNG